MMRYFVSWSYHNASPTMRTAEFLLGTSTLKEDVELESSIEYFLDGEEITARVYLIRQLKDKRRVWRSHRRILIRSNDITSSVYY